MAKKLFPCFKNVHVFMKNNNHILRNYSFIYVTARDCDLGSIIRIERRRGFARKLPPTFTIIFHENHLIQDP